MVTDYDCWHPDHEHVDVAAVIRVLLENAEKGQALVAKAVPHLQHRPGHCPKGCDHALDNALITAPERRDPALMRKLDAVAGRIPRARSEERRVGNEWVRTCRTWGWPDP